MGGPVLYHMGLQSTHLRRLKGTFCTIKGGMSNHQTADAHKQTASFARSGLRITKNTGLC